MRGWNGELPERWGLLEYSENSGNNSSLIATTTPARRLKPEVPMTEEMVERLRHAIIQSTMWRHYGHGTVVQYKRYANATDYGTYDDRVIDGDLFAPGDLAPASP